MALGWSREEVIDLFPSYARYFDAMTALAESITSPYLRFHAGHALARACMQTTIIDRVLEAGFDGFTIARLRERELPDSRFMRLRRCPLRRPEVTHPDPRTRQPVEADSLIAEMFDVELEKWWNTANKAMYEAAALGPGSTLPVNGHLDRTPHLVTTARRLARTLGVEATRRSRPAQARGIVLENIEFEVFSVADPSRADSPR
ncbi:hypothetical protein [Nonomuraea aurantiaca]|uniref:hypothetical protein n=1 Tax=Nonomuraea aurantiaca TaxID=2878562 RepID=UPI001CD93E57|nr:hypothetical protein [Nonomuraea aurantiaca]MCA2220029.1 hypothetical protein [Nonomuraea aurantiaca]